MLEKGGFESGLPVEPEIPMCSEFSCVQNSHVSMNSRFLFQAYIPFKFEIKLINYFPRPIHIFKFVAFLDLCKDFRLFRFKDRISLSLRSRIVYKYKCQCCNALYVGETVRHFHKRISEHMGISGSTGKPLSKPFSKIRDHHQSSGHPISPDDFSILSSCSSSFELLLRESLLISKLKPSLNANLSSVPLTLYN